VDGCKEKPLEASVEMNIQIVGKCFRRIFKAKEELWKIQILHNANKNIFFKKIL
jgi:hypothetical protein